MSIDIEHTQKFGLEIVYEVIKVPTLQNSCIIVYSLNISL